MQAGLLKYPITFLQLTTSKDVYGAVTKMWQTALTTKCARHKSRTKGMSIDAMEEFIQGTVVVQVRNNALINDKQRFDFGNYRYRITLIEQQDENTLIITGTRRNDNEKGVMT